ncbi:MAG: hypothetical protein RL490_931, partial [Pseudomonadota bacterium]
LHPSVSAAGEDGPAKDAAATLQQAFLAGAAACDWPQGLIAQLVAVAPGWLVAQLRRRGRAHGWRRRLGDRLGRDTLLLLPLFVPVPQVRPLQRLLTLPPLAPPADAAGAQRFAGRLLDCLLLAESASLTAAAVLVEMVAARSRDDGVDDVGAALAARLPRELAAIDVDGDRLSTPLPDRLDGRWLDTLPTPLPRHAWFTLGDRLAAAGARRAVLASLDTADRLRLLERLSPLAGVDLLVQARGWRDATERLFGIAIADDAVGAVTLAAALEPVGADQPRLRSAWLAMAADAARAAGLDSRIAARLLAVLLPDGLADPAAADTPPAPPPASGAHDHVATATRDDHRSARMMQPDGETAAAAPLDLPDGPLTPAWLDALPTPLPAAVRAALITALRARPDAPDRLAGLDVMTRRRLLATLDDGAATALAILDRLDAIATAAGLDRDSLPEGFRWRLLVASLGRPRPDDAHRLAEHWTRALLVAAARALPAPALAALRAALRQAGGAAAAPIAALITALTDGATADIAPAIDSLDASLPPAVRRQLLAALATSAAARTVAGLDPTRRARLLDLAAPRLSTAADVAAMAIGAGDRTTGLRDTVWLAALAASGLAADPESAAIHWLAALVAAVDAPKGEANPPAQRSDADHDPQTGPDTGALLAAPSFGDPKQILPAVASSAMPAPASSAPRSALMTALIDGTLADIERAIDRMGAFLPPDQRNSLLALLATQDTARKAAGLDPARREKLLLLGAPQLQRFAGLVMALRDGTGGASGEMTLARDIDRLALLAKAGRAAEPAAAILHGLATVTGDRREPDAMTTAFGTGATMPGAALATREEIALP